MHCHLGFYRSPACAIIAAYLQRRTPKEAVNHILKNIVPNSDPNQRVLALANNVLDLPQGQKFTDYTQKI